MVQKRPTSANNFHLSFDAPRIRYIKLGDNHRWWKQCLEEGIIRLGFSSGLPEIIKAAEAKDWDFIRNYWKDRTGTPTQHTNQTREFFEDDGSTLWITFEDGCLYYGFSVGGKAIPIADDGGKASSFRAMNAAGWQNVDATGNVLRIDQLSGKLTKTAAFRQTICKLSPEPEEYLRLRLAGKVSKNLEDTEAAKRQLLNCIEVLVKSLTWRDFEILVELIFAQSGWRRVSRTGGSQRTTDIDLDNPVTGDRAFVQVKSATSQAQLEDYIQRKGREKSDYDRMFYVYHTGEVETESDDVMLWDVKKVSEQIISNGLIDWVINRAK